MVSTWMGDHSRAGSGCSSYKYCEIPEAEKRGLRKQSIWEKLYRNVTATESATSFKTVFRTVWTEQWSRVGRFWTFFAIFQIQQVTQNTITYKKDYFFFRSKSWVPFRKKHQNTFEKKNCAILQRLTKSTRKSVNQNKRVIFKNFFLSTLLFDLLTTLQ